MLKKMLWLFWGWSFALAQTPNRPHDPWVFRSVLDGRARMLTVALDDEMWIAYDATYGSLYKAWKGGVFFDGSVYTTRHGPQPTSMGTAYTEGIAGKPIWQVYKAGKAVASTLYFKGYERQGVQTVTLKYELVLKTGHRIFITESPSFSSSSSKRPMLARTFTTRNVPASYQVRMGFRVGALASEKDLSTTGQYEILSRTAKSYGQARLETLEGRLSLKSNGKTTFDAVFDPAIAEGVDPAALVEMTKEAEIVTYEDPLISIPLVHIPPRIDGEVDAFWNEIPSQNLTHQIVGDKVPDADLFARFQVAYDWQFMYVLVTAKDDQKAGDSPECWNDDGVSIYLDGGGEKNDKYDDNDGQFCVGRDGKTMWNSKGWTNIKWASKDTEDGYRMEIAIPLGYLNPNPAPKVKMGLEVYVFDDDDGKDLDSALGWWDQWKKAWENPKTFATVELGESMKKDDGENPREAGVALRVYHIQKPLRQLYDLVAGQTPNYSVTVPQLNLSSNADFGGFEENFVADVSGLLNIPQDGLYEFRLTNDDGARMWVGGKKIIENDGLKSTAAALQGEIELKKGEVPYRIYYFQATGNKALRLEWRPVGASEFNLIPASIFSTPAGEVRVTAPGIKRVMEPGKTYRAGDTIPLQGVHPSYDLFSLRSADFKPRVGGMDFLPDGRLIMCNWDPEGSVYVVENPSASDLSKIRYKKIANGLAEPLGIKVVNGRIFVLQKQELTELIDHDKDGLIDEYKTIANGWGVTANFHEFAFGLAHKNGFLYATLATAINPGGRSTQPQNIDRGRVMKINLQNGHYELIAAGLRTPNGINVGLDNELFVTDNQGDWIPSSKLLHIREGAFYGNRSVEPIAKKDTPEVPPVLWMPQNEIGNSPSQPIIAKDGPYKGQMLHGEVTHGGIKRDFIEKVNGQYQGAVFRFTQGLEAGVNRLVWGPDGGLYIGGIGSSGNWGQEGKLWYGLQRLKFNGKTTFEMLAVRAKTNGFEIELTKPLASTQFRPEDFDIQQWRYQPTEEYGGPKVDWDTLAVKRFQVSADRKKIALHIEGLKKGHVVYLRLKGPFLDEGGSPLWSTEAWYTLNQVPANQPLAFEATQVPSSSDWQTLFDGADTHKFRGFKKERVPAAWKIENGALFFDPKEKTDRGDLITKDQFDNFELVFEWKISEGGNSGVMFRSDEAHLAPWLTGPEYQVLDDDLHPDGKFPKHTAAANYALDVPKYKAARAVGEWNEARLVVHGAQVEHWLNGYKVVEYTLWSPAWKAKVAESKFKTMPDYGMNKTGHLVFQDHGDKVWYRNIKIKPLK